MIVIALNFQDRSVRNNENHHRVEFFVSFFVFMTEYSIKRKSFRDMCLILFANFIYICYNVSNYS